MMLRQHLTPRLGRPEDIAAAVALLASAESAESNYVNCLSLGKIVDGLRC